MTAALPQSAAAPPAYRREKEMRGVAFDRRGA